MTAKLKNLIQYLDAQGIDVRSIHQNPSFIDAENKVKGNSPSWSSIATQTKDAVDVSALDMVESMSLASMAAMHILDVSNSMKVLDVCAAPGMKGLYLNKLVDDVEYYANDLSGNRLARLSRLFAKHGIKPAQITKYDARFIDRAYDPEYFDRIIIDAPCSGEGVILGGNTKLLDTWSTAKVKRLQQLQIKILKSSWKLLKPNGRLVYATCTLNKNENERVIKKALGIDIEVYESPLHTINLHMLNNGMSWRVLPSVNSIGFFIAVIAKGQDD